jgi:SNF2 family DNA or RNA helicase
VPKPDCVLTSYECLAADASELKAVTWEAVVLDERQPWQRAALAKAHAALADLSARWGGRGGGG